MKGFFKIFKTKDIDWTTLPDPDDSISYFEQIKSLSDKYWTDHSPNPNIYGFQFQNGSYWKSGLNDEEIEQVEDSIGINFPLPLRNFYKTMNGLTKPGINLFGSNGQDPTCRPLYYSYPDDIKLISEMIAWIYEESKVTSKIIAENNISRIFPITGHRFMLIDVPGNPILSMYGTDIVYYAENLSKFLANAIFSNIDNVSAFESPPDNQPKIKFWLDSE